MTALRKALGDELLAADRDTLQLNPDFPVWADAREISRWQAADVAKPAIALSLRTLYRGDLLADFYDDWISPLREQLRTRYLDALLHITQHYRAQSDYALARDFAQHTLSIDPANERAHQHLMFCAVMTGDRTAALDQFANCERALRDELNVPPSPDTLALYRWIKQSTAEKSSAARITNLPIPLTSFIGRQHATRELKELIPHARLVTLTGAGGSGKTRLAIQVATDLIDQFNDGVWWVTFEALTDAAQVRQLIATALGIPESPRQPLDDSLRNWLQTRHVLIVLDNCEHLADPIAQVVAALTTHCPRAYFLATSREPLRVSGEVAWRVPPLGLPEVARPSAVVVGEFAQIAIGHEAVRLFVDRAVATRRDFQLTDANATAVIEICQRLDGIPLALELAAARVNVFTPAEIAARLNDRFRLLTDGNRTVLPRQQTLRALLDWSYDLLTSDERRLLQQLAVFAGGWTLAAMEHICGEWGALDLLARLVAKSLVVSEVRDGATRYRLLETIRAYARDRLIDSGEDDQTAIRHAAYFCAYAEAIDDQLKVGHQPEAIQQLDREHDNVRAALAWTLPHEPEMALRLANALGDFWNARGHWSEAHDWFAQVLAHPALAAPTRARATALNYAGSVAFRRGDLRSARALFDQTLAIFNGLEERAGIANMHNNLGLIAAAQSDLPTARTYHEQALALRRELGDLRAVALSLNNLGIVLKDQGDYAGAQTCYEEALRLRREQGDLRGLAAVLGNLGTLAQHRGDLPRARAYLAETLTAFRELGNKHGLAATYGNLARIAESQGQLAEARTYAEQTHALFTEIGDRLNIALALNDLGSIALHQHELARARECYRESLTLSRAMGARLVILDSLGRLAHLDLLQGEPQRATRILASIEALRGSIGAPFKPEERAVHERDLAEAHAQLDAATFETDWQAGGKLNWETACGCALGK